MKKILVMSSMLFAFTLASAQQTPNNTKNKKNNTTTNKNNTGTNKNNTTTTTTNSGTNTNSTDTNTSGNNTTTGTDHNGMNHGNGDMSGTMVSTGRYAAMGVQTGSLHRKDAKFLVLAGSSNTLELQLSKLAQQRATNQAVKDYANMMVEHHTMAAQEMKKLLSSKGAMIPDTALLPMHKLQIETVMAAQGADFDKAYMRIMVDAHEEDVDEFEDEVTDARDADVRAFASRMMPVLQTHYSRAKEIRKQVR